MRRPLLLALAAAAAAALLPAGAAALTTRPCKGHVGFNCATLRVPLEHGAASSSTLGLRVAIERPRHGTSGYLVALSGGPGQPAVAYAESFRASLAPALRRRRLVLIDQRGTGAGGLSCPALQRLSTIDPVSTMLVEDCANKVGPSRRFYATTDSVLDLEDLRAALGAPKLELMGISYGTFVAQQYARRFPARVDGLILDSVVAPDGVDPYLLDTYTGLPRVLREQCARRRCSGATRDPVGDLKKLIALLGKGSVKGKIVDAAGGARPSALHDQTELLFLVMSGDLNPFLQAAVPGAINAALAGDTASLLRLRRLAAGPISPVSEFSWGLNVATTCADTHLPYTLQQPFAERWGAWRNGLNGVDDSAFAPFTRDAVLTSAVAHDCLRWPQGDTPSPPSTDPLPDVPALILSGRLDTRTPLENARALQAQLPQGQLLSVGGTGHDVLDADITGCAARALRSFADGKAIGTPCRNRTNIVIPTARPPRSLRSYKSARGVGGTRGREVYAVLDSVFDARLTVLQTLFAGFTKLQGGGLRGGRFVADADGETLTLRRYSLVAGLRVSGRLRASGGSIAGTVRVDGPGSLDGRLHVAGSGLTEGTLGGKRVRFKPRAGATAVAASAAGRRIVTRLPSLREAVARVRARHR